MFEHPADAQTEAAINESLRLSVSKLTTKLDTLEAAIKQAEQQVMQAQQNPPPKPAGGFSRTRSGSLRRGGIKREVTAGLEWRKFDGTTDTGVAPPPER
eukprot:m.40209 g.40209  ORF g.40209 m.40209 type:complete len:99 (+) comp5932_c0_seq1:365-661(+)